MVEHEGISNPPLSAARIAANRRNAQEKGETKLSLRKRPIVSEAMLAANRANARKSTGPRSAEGKARSRLNGFKHGQRSRVYQHLLREIWVDHQLAIEHMDLLYELQKGPRAGASRRERKKTQPEAPPALVFERVKYLLERRRTAS